VTVGAGGEVYVNALKRAPLCVSGLMTVTDTVPVEVTAGVIATSEVDSRRLRGGRGCTEAHGRAGDKAGAG